jgi:DNA-binding XRE family transcriptional regulator
MRLFLAEAHTRNKSMSVQFIEIDGRKMAVLPVEDYERLMDAVDDEADVAAAERAEKRRAAGEEYVPMDMVERLVEGENALRVWREHRQLSIGVLANVSGINKSTISLLENDKAYGRPATWRALADALRVTVDDILPVSDAPHRNP